jgi:hypothetical protein
MVATPCFAQQISMKGKLHTQATIQKIVTSESYIDTKHNDFTRFVKIKELSYNITKYYYTKIISNNVVFYNEKT